MALILSLSNELYLFSNQNQHQILILSDPRPMVPQRQQQANNPITLDLQSTCLGSLERPRHTYLHHIVTATP